MSRSVKREKTARETSGCTASLVSNCDVHTRMYIHLPAVISPIIIIMYGLHSHFVFHAKFLTECTSHYATMLKLIALPALHK